MRWGPSPRPEATAEAARVLRGVSHRTPVLASRLLDERCSGRMLFKCENLQRTGAFKFRGAYVALSALDPERRAAGAVTFSSGNHGQALALAGRLLGIRVTVVMPRDAPRVKIAAVEGYGGRVVFYDRDGIPREEVASRWRKEHGGSLIPPYDHPAIIAGQGTAALEFLEEAPRLERIVVPVGGGGLLAGTALAVRHAAPETAVIGVEPAQADDAARSLRAGRRIAMREPETVADGLRTPSLGEHNFEVIRTLVDEIVTVGEAEIIEAMRLVWTRMKLVVEPSAAVPLAAMLAGAVESSETTGIILSGGNVDPARAGRLFAESSETEGAR